MAGAGAKVLGAITIGQGCGIGANAVVVNDVAPHKVVVGRPGKVITRRELRQSIDLQHNQLPDVLSKQLDHLSARINQLENLLQVEAIAENDFVI